MNLGSLTFEAEGVADAKLGHMHSVVEVCIHVLEVEEAVDIKVAHGKRPCEVIRRKLNPFQVLGCCQYRDMSVEMVVAHINVLKIGELAPGTWNRAGELILHDLNELEFL